MTTRSKAKPIVKAAKPTVVPSVPKTYYVGEFLDEMIVIGTYDSLEQLLQSSNFNSHVEDNAWLGNTLYFMTKDTVTVAGNKVEVTSYKLKQGSYVVEKP